MARLLAALLATSLACGAAASERTFSLDAGTGTAPPPHDVLRVAQGDVVVMNFTARQAGEIHLHGYRLVAKVDPARTAQWKFTAHATGRYRLEWHAAGEPSTRHHAPPLSILEVVPR